MKRYLSKPSREEVLDAFAVEADAGSATLQRYLRDYPEFASALVDLSRERSRFICENKEPLNKDDQIKIDQAWAKHVMSSQSIIADPFADLSVEKLRQIATRLDVPRQIVTAFRERRVNISSVPRRFLVRFAEAIDSSVEVLVSALTPSGQSLARSYKAIDRPRATPAVMFEQLLIDAGVPEERRVELLADDD
jgi:hypothetical protein